MNEDQIPNPPSRGKLAALTGIAFVVASIIVVLFILPVEFRLDPTGFGRLTGLDQLAGPEQVQVAVPVSTGAAPTGEIARYFTTPYRSDRIDIPLKGGDELEYKVKMKGGDTITYSWEVEGTTDPMLFYFDFHSESRPNPAGTKPKVAEYLQTLGLRSSGSLIAPFEGVHGWYLQNQSENPVVVHLRVSGFYDVVPPGEYGNLSGVPLPSP